MFSGHSMYFIHVALMLHQFADDSKLKKTIGWLIAVVGTFMLIVCRLHYTSDVLMAWVSAK
jgi:membrane-associated phospholipid phosphatase